jgi:hypothetical protein
MAQLSLCSGWSLRDALCTSDADECCWPCGYHRDCCRDNVASNASDGDILAINQFNDMTLYGSNGPWIEFDAWEMDDLGNAATPTMAHNSALEV